MLIDEIKEHLLNEYEANEIDLKNENWDILSQNSVQSIDVLPFWCHENVRDLHESLTSSW